MPGINPDPWQTDTSIGDWYLQPELEVPAGELGDPHARGHRQQERQPAAERRAAARRLARPRGRADARSSWPPGSPSTARPSTARGPGWSTAKARSRPRAATSRRTSPTRAKDIRFTTKGATLYAIALGWPEDGRLTHPVPGPACGRTGNRIKRVELARPQGQAAVHPDRGWPVRDAAGATGKQLHLHAQNHRRGLETGGELR